MLGPSDRNVDRIFARMMGLSFPPTRPHPDEMVLRVMISDERGSTEATMSLSTAEADIHDALDGLMAGRHDGPVTINVAYLPVMDAETWDA